MERAVIRGVMLALALALATAAWAAEAPTLGAVTNLPSPRAR